MPIKSENGTKLGRGYWGYLEKISIEVVGVIGMGVVVGNGMGIRDGSPSPPPTTRGS